MRFTGKHAGESSTKRRHRASRKNWRSPDDHELPALHAGGSGTAFAAHRRFGREKRVLRCESVRGSRSQRETPPRVRERTRALESATQTACRGGAGKPGDRFVETGWLTPASCSKASGFPASTPPRLLGSVSGPADAGLTPRRWSLLLCCGLAPTHNARENDVPPPRQTKTSREFLRVTL